jgi:hypothetical protein
MSLFVALTDNLNVEECIMARNYKQEYKTQVERNEHPDRMERQRARRKLDAEGVPRKGKDVAHVKALSKGGSNSDGVKLQSPSQNRSFKRKADGSMK